MLHVEKPDAKTETANSAIDAADSLLRHDPGTRLAIFIPGYWPEEE
jgi:hypothetical protein